MTLNIERGKASLLFEDFLKELGVCEEATEQAKRCIPGFLTAQKEIKKCPKSGNGQTA